YCDAFMLSIAFTHYALQITLFIPSKYHFKHTSHLESAKKASLKNACLAPFLRNPVRLKLLPFTNPIRMPFAVPRPPNPPNKLPPTIFNVCIWENGITYWPLPPPPLEDAHHQ